MRVYRCRPLMGVGLLALWAAIAVQGQTFGTITGEVRDASEGVIPGAAITATNTATNVVRNAETNAEGIYSIPALNPGVYVVRAEVEGFRAASRANVLLQVQQTARIDFALEIGAVSEVVEVTGAPPLLDTENATVGTVIEEKRITDLPLNGRSFFNLAALSPNVNFGFQEPQQASGRQGGTRAQLTMSLAGARSAWSNYTLDGISNTDINFNLYIMQPSVEALQEFKVQTGVYPAEFGRGAGQINVMTKGGGNDFHLSAFEFLRNDILDAAPYFFADPESPNVEAPEQPAYRQNQYGITVTGPIIKNKLFFMGNFEGFKSRTSSTSFFTSMPESMRNGDFSILPDQLYDPYTRTGTQGNRTADPYVNNQIPVSQHNPSSQLVLRDFAPLPNIAQSSVPTRNYLWIAKEPVDKDQITGRIDFTESSTSQWFGRYSWTDESELNPGVQLNGSETVSTAHQFVIANTRVFSATMVNDLRVGYNSMFNNITQELAGIRNVNEELNTAIPVDDENSWGIPNMSLQNSTLSGFGNSANGPFTIDDKIYQVNDNFSWISGKHSFRFGGEWRYNQFLQIGNEFARGRFTANGQFTEHPDTLAGGYTGADLLLGTFRQLEGAVDLARGDFRNTELAAYIDDTWKITSKLTINVGMRWEFAQPLLDKFGNQPNIQLQQPLPSTANVADQSLHPTFVRTGNGDFYEGLNFRYLGPVQLARDGRLGDRLIDSDYNNWAPRLGIAYSPNDKWAVRSGFGVFYSQESKNSIFDMNRAAGGRATITPNRSDIPTLSYDNYIDSSNLPVSFTPGLVWGADSDLATPYTLQYLFNVQRAIGRNSTLEVGYTGNVGRKLNYLMNPNAPLPDDGSPLNSREPYPEWAGMQFLIGDGTSNYNALSGKFRTQFSGFTTSFAYTWSKALDVLSAIRGNGQFTVANQRCPKCDFGPAGFNVPHRFTSSILYELPFDVGGPAGLITDGWQLSTITTISSGAPLNAASGWDAAGQGQGFPHSNRLHCTAGVDPFASNPTTDNYFAGSRVDPAGGDYRFQPTAFRNPAQGEFGNCGRNTMVGPGSWNIDFSVMKDFRITESQALQFRMEMFNALNHPNWNNPSIGFGGNNPTTAAASFGRIRSMSPMRDIQFALKYYF